ncbi:hypothetical protein GCM10027034_19860 [Ramlibacter solisilvae]|uniref:thermonuclease family protein n=1 Tax=Ramlibacter tataouinensis TaxID=94132 RepID=UPI001D104066|nr:hypothetical protein [Ramlibacter tataouinensis]
MKRRTFITFLVALVALVASWVTAFNAAWAETLNSIVIAVADGDTITVLDAQRIQHKVRLAGIDAPEKKQDFGQLAKQNLSATSVGR